MGSGIVESGERKEKNGDSLFVVKFSKEGKKGGDCDLSSMKTDAATSHVGS